MSPAAAFSLLVSREHMATFAPSAANFSAAARAMPSLEAATITFRFFSPRSTWLPSRLLACTLTKIGVVFVDPILAWGIKDVQVDRILERNSLMRHIGRDAEYFPGRDSDFPVLDEEMQCAFKNVGDLLIVMTMQRHFRAFLKQDTRHHHVGAHDHLPAYERAHGFYFDVIPLGVLSGFCHVVSPAKVTTNRRESFRGEALRKLSSHQPSLTM